MAGQSERVADAVQRLLKGQTPAEAAEVIARGEGVSSRTARRIVAAARAELANLGVEPFDPLLDLAIRHSCACRLYADAKAAGQLGAAVGALRLRGELAELLSRLPWRVMNG